MKGLDFTTVLKLPNGIAISETVIVSWVVMLVLIVFSLLVTRAMKEIPRGIQNIVELGIDALNKYASAQFGRYASFLGCYMGTLFLFLLVANVIPCITPVGFEFAGHEYSPPFEIKPPSRDISFTAPLAMLTVLFTIIFGIAARKPVGWLANHLQPIPFMLPFNILEYATRLLSLSLRLFGNMLGGFVIMSLLEGLMPIALPAIASLYFDFFDGLMQAGIFTFLSCIYISEACKTEHSI
jgi:F-type H+-transporting ATPase subunit a